MKRRRGRLIPKDGYEVRGKRFSNGFCRVHGSIVMEYDGLTEAGTSRMHPAQVGRLRLGGTCQGKQYPHTAQCRSLPHRVITQYEVHTGNRQKQLSPLHSLLLQPVQPRAHDGHHVHDSSSLRDRDTAPPRGHGGTTRLIISMTPYINVQSKSTTPPCPVSRLRLRPPASCVPDLDHPCPLQAPTLSHAHRSLIISLTVKLRATARQ